DIADKIETEIVVERRVDCVRRSDFKERVTIGGRPNDHLGSNIARRTRPIVHDKLLAEPFRQRLSNQAPDNVGRGSTRKADNEANRSRWIVIPSYGARNDKHSARACG